MVERDYYPLEKVTKISGYTYDDLINSAALEKLKIHALISCFDIYALTFRSLGNEFLYGNRCWKLYGEIIQSCLQEFEAGNAEVELMLRGETGNNWYESDSNGVLLRTQNEEVQVNFEVYHKNSSKKVLLRECVLIVLADELERFMAANSATIESQQADRGKKSKQAKLNESYSRFIAVGSPGYNIYFDNKEKFLESIKEFDFETWRLVTPKDGIKEWQRGNHIALKFRPGRRAKRQTNQKL